MPTRSKRGAEPLASLADDDDDDKLTPEQLRAKYGAPTPLKSLEELEREAKVNRAPKKRKVGGDNFFAAKKPNGHTATLALGEGVVECSFGKYDDAKGFIPEEVSKASTVEGEVLKYSGSIEDVKTLFLAAGFDVSLASEEDDDDEGDEGDAEDDGDDEEAEEGDDEEEEEEEA